MKCEIDRMFAGLLLSCPREALEQTFTTKDDRVVHLCLECCDDYFEPLGLVPFSKSQPDGGSGVE